MISFSEAKRLFPFSILINPELRIMAFGRTLEARLGAPAPERFIDRFEVQRWQGNFDLETLGTKLSKPVIIVHRESGMTLMGSFNQVDAGFLFLGGPRVTRLEELQGLDLNIDDFAAHDGIMNYLFMLQELRSATTEAIQMHEEAAVREGRYRQIFEQSHDIILSMDEQGNVQLANSTAQKLLDLERPAVPLLDLVHAQDKERMRHALELALRKPERIELDVRLEGRKQRILSFRGRLEQSPSPDGREHLVGFFRDVTEELRIEADLARTNEQLTRAQQMEAIGRLAGAVAHDFNNILAVVIGAASLLRDDIPKEDVRRLDIDLVLQSAQKGAAISRQLLSLSSRQPTPYKKTDLVQQTRDFMPILDLMRGRSTVHFNTSCESCWVAIDPNRYEQVLMNLVGNARDAMPEGGEIHVGLQLTTNQSRAILTVRDSGIGMDREMRERIFEPFFTRKQKEKGSGLGLSIVYGIVNDINGQIELDSEPDVGTCFTITLPTTDSELEGADAPVQRPGIRRDARTALVEDDPSLRRVIQRILASCGLTPQTYEGADSARRNLLGHPVPIDLLITDVVLEDGCGLELAEELATKGTALQVLVITGRADMEKVNRLVTKHGWALLLKPFTPEDLEDTLAHLMASPQQQPPRSPDA